MWEVWPSMTVWTRMREGSAHARGYACGYHDAREQHAHRVRYRAEREHTARAWAWLWATCFWLLLGAVMGVNL